MPKSSAPDVVRTVARHYANCVKNDVFTIDEATEFLNELIKHSKANTLVVNSDKLYTIIRKDDDNILYDIASRTTQKNTMFAMHMKMKGSHVPLTMVIRSVLMVTITSKELDPLSICLIKEMKDNEGIKTELRPLVKVWKNIARRKNERDLFGKMD
jgi:phosphopantetheine adenylyltransferase